LHLGAHEPPRALDRLDAGSFVRVRVDAEGAPPRSDPSVEGRLHQYTYRRRPDVGAIAHLHPQRLVLLDAAGHRIRMITTDHCVYLGEVEHVTIRTVDGGTISGAEVIERFWSGLVRWATVDQPAAMASRQRTVIADRIAAHPEAERVQSEFDAAAT